jgi:hypothetical protein
MPRRHISKIAAVAIIALAATFSTPKPAEANIGALLNLLKEAASYHIGGFKFVVPWDASAKILHLCAKSPSHCSVTAKPIPHHYERSTGAKIGPYVVGCVMLSAGSLIVASVVKANAMGQPLRWMSQAQFEAYERTRDRSVELTAQEAAIIGFTCGIGSVAVLRNYWR